MIAAIIDAGLLKAVTDNARPTMFAGGSQGVDRTFKTVERVRPAVHDYLERLVVVVAAILAGRHECTSLSGPALAGLRCLFRRAGPRRRRSIGRGLAAKFSALARRGVI